MYPPVRDYCMVSFRLICAGLVGGQRKPPNPFVNFLPSVLTGSQMDAGLNNNHSP